MVTRLNYLLCCHLENRCVFFLFFIQYSDDDFRPEFATINRFIPPSCRLLLLSGSLTNDILNSLVNDVFATRESYRLITCPEMDRSNIFYLAERYEGDVLKVISLQIRLLSIVVA